MTMRRVTDLNQQRSLLCSKRKKLRKNQLLMILRRTMKLHQVRKFLQRHQLNQQRRRTHSLTMTMRMRSQTLKSRFLNPSRLLSLLSNPTVMMAKSLQPNQLLSRNQLVSLQVVQMMTKMSCLPRSLRQFNQQNLLLRKINLTIVMTMRMILPRRNRNLWSLYHRQNRMPRKVHSMTVKKTSNHFRRNLSLSKNQ